MKSTCLRLLASACILSSGSAFADTSDMAKLFAKGSSFLTQNSPLMVNTLGSNPKWMVKMRWSFSTHKQ